MLKDREELNGSGRMNKVIPLLGTVPDYVGLEGNAEAAKLARKRSTALLVGPESLCGLGYTFLKWD